MQGYYYAHEVQPPNYTEFSYTYYAALVATYNQFYGTVVAVHYSELGSQLCLIVS